MNRITITAGIGEDRDGATIAPDKLARAMATIRGHLAATFGGFTEQQSVGGWINEAGRMILEPSIRWIVLVDGGHGTDEAARVVREALNQSAVLLEVEAVAAEFVTDAEVIA